MPKLNLKPKGQLKKEIMEAIERVVDSGVYINGPEVKFLEDKIAKICKVKHAVAVGSGTNALQLSLRAFGIVSGDQVITATYTFISSAEVIVGEGAFPIFVDLNQKIRGVYPNKKIKAVIPVHLFGEYPKNIDQTVSIAKRNNWRIIEDMAQHFPAKLSGDVGCLSFYPTKQLGGMGDGGMVITNKKWIDNKIRLLRNHGASPKNKYYYFYIGTNSRMNEIQAAILKVKLKYKLRQMTAEEKKLYYHIPLHLQPCFISLGYKKGDFPIAEKKANEVKKHLSELL